MKQKGREEQQPKQAVVKRWRSEKHMCEKATEAGTVEGGIDIICHPAIQFGPELAGRF